MKKPLLLLPVMASFLAAASTGFFLQEAQRLDPLDPLVAAPQFHRLVFENDLVRVLDVRVKPGEFEPFHKHIQSVIVILQGGTVRLTLPDGTASEVSLSLTPDPEKGEPPQVFWEEAETHSVKNIGQTPVRLIRVEVKKAAPSG